jgi:hypothetical protein
MYRTVESAFEGQIGVARCDITPPMGIYSRMWGAANHEVANSIHRPLQATAITFAEMTGGDPLVLVALDLGWWRAPEDEQYVRHYVLEQLGLNSDRLMINLSHTHSGPSTSLEVNGKPGGALVRPYLDQLREQIVTIIGEAIADSRHATLSWATGHCSLATSRHLPAPDGSGELVAHRPSRRADDTLLVGRITTKDNVPLGVIVNYACHPTSLGWGNEKISPDFVGAMRECVEQQTGGAACMFIQGASGDLAPRRQFEPDTDVADANGRVLGYSVCSVLEGMLPHGCDFQFSHTVESGTRLGVWETTRNQASQTLDAISPRIELPTKRLPSESDLRAKSSGVSEYVLNERIERLKHIRSLIDGQDTVQMPIWAWRLGNSFLIGTPTESYSALQMELRHRFPNSSVAVMNIVNGYYSYQPPIDHFDIENYEVRVSLFAPGCLEATIEECDKCIRELNRPRRPTVAPPYISKRGGLLHTPNTPES